MSELAYTPNFRPCVPQLRTCKLISSDFHNLNDLEPSVQVREKLCRA
jgi:hypothetical protein